ncbi:MAG: GbsR/MarR family transcriptional regulator [Oligoflexales bacterium]
MNPPPHVREVAESIGQFIEYWGFKHIHGRIWTTIFLARNPISSPEIVASLGVSKGLVSVAINELIHYGLITKASKTIHGGQTYLATEDIGSVIRNVLRERELKLLNENENKLHLLAAHSVEELEGANISVSKLNDLIRITQANKNLLTTLISKNFHTLENWIQFIKKSHQILRLHK